MDTKPRDPFERTRKPTIGLLIAALLAGTCWALLRERPEMPRAPSARVESTPPAESPPHAPDSSGEGQQIPVDLPAMDHTTEDLQGTSASTGANSRESERSEGEQWNRFPRSSVDLATLFLRAPSRVRVDLLVRHTVLNKVDLELEAADLAELEALVGKNIATVEPRKKEFNKARAEDMKELVAQGKVQPAQLPRPSDSDIVRFAKQVAGPSEDVQKYIDYYRKNPPAAAMARVNHVLIDGRTYLREDFPTLPASDAMADEVRFYSIQFLHEVCLWFATRGLASDNEILKLLERAMELPL